MTENNDFTRPSVALVDFAADDHIPELLREYTTADHNKSFNNSRLVLNSDEVNMQNRDPNVDDDETSNMKGVSRLKAGNVNSHYQYDSLDVAPPTLDHSSGGIDDVEVVMQNGKRITPEGSSEDDLPLDISAGAHHAGAPGASAEGSDDDSYDHCHAPLPINSNLRAQKQLIAACCVTVVFMIGEVVGGYLSGSLAIMTDAAHLLSDVASFGISIFALWIARRPATTRMSFGYYRAEVLGAVISVLIIWVLTGVLCYLAVERIIHPDYTIDANIMLITSGVGVGINITLIVILQAGGGMHLHSHGGGGGHEHLQEDVEGGEETEGGAGHKKHKHTKNINVRAAFIHVLGDLVQSIGVLIAAGIIKAKPEWQIADPICTFMFSVLVLITTFTILRDAINVLMEAVPRSINYPSLKEDLTKLPGVKMAHSLHVWSLTTSRVAMAVHLAIDEQIDNDAVLQQASNMVQTKYGIHYSTIQVERYQPVAMENCVRCSQPC